MSTNYQYINLDYLNLMADNDPEMREVMLGMLLEELPEEVAKMRQNLDAENYDELSSVSHKMKSTLAFVGNDVMTEANKKIELNAKLEQELESLPNLMQTLEDYLGKVMSELETAAA